MNPRSVLLRLFATLCLVAASCGQWRQSSEYPIDLQRGDFPVDRSGAPVQIVISSAEPLPDPVLQGVRDIPGVITAGTRASGLADLQALDGGATLPPRPHGTVLPVSVVAVDPEVVEELIGPGEVVEALRRGETVVPREAAEFRGLASGDQVGLAGGGASQQIRVGVVADEGVSSFSEFVLPMELARALGIEPTSGLLLLVEPQAAMAVEEEVKRMVGDHPVRIRSNLRGAPPGSILPLTEVKRIFGEFWFRPLAGGRVQPDPRWVEENITWATVPILGPVLCHRGIIPQLSGAMAEIERRGFAGEIQSFDGCYSPRMQFPEPTSISRHAFGIAVDLNASTNRFGDPPMQDPALVEVMERWGFGWGGRWTIPDGMHFEFLFFPD